MNFNWLYGYLKDWWFLSLCAFYREPDEWVLESEVQSTKHVGIRKAAASNPEQVSLALYPAISGCTPPTVRAKQRRKPVKNSW